MNKRKENLGEFLNSIYCPKSKKEEMEKLLDFLKNVEIRGIAKSDFKKIRLSALVISTKGKGEWETFDSWSVKFLDLNHVSDVFAEVYLYDNEGRGHPTKIRVDNPKVSILEWERIK